VSTSDGSDTMTTGYEHCEVAPPDGVVGSHRLVRRASVGSPTSTTTTTSSVSFMVQTLPLASPFHATGGIEQMFHLDIPTTIKEESTCIGTAATGGDPGIRSIPPHYSINNILVACGALLKTDSAVTMAT